MRSIAFFQHQELSGVAGGNATAGSWENRKITNVTSDLNSIITLDPLTGIFTLNFSGKYNFFSALPQYQVNSAQSRLVDADSGAVILLGECIYAYNVAGGYCKSIVQGLITGEKNQRFILQTRVTTSQATNGYGVPASFGTEVYTVGSISVLG